MSRVRRVRARRVIASNMVDARVLISSPKMPRNTEVFAPTFSGAAVVRSDDITRDPSYGKNEPRQGMPPGHLPVRSYLAVPVISRTSKVLPAKRNGTE